MREIIQEFLAESLENLDQLDNEFVALEENPTDHEILSSIFRTIHSIKGTCGFLGFEKLEKVTHAGEDVLGLLRDGKLMLNTEMASTLLTMLDTVREMLKTIESTGTDGDDPHSTLVEKLVEFKNTENTQPAETKEPVTEEASADTETPAEKASPEPTDDTQTVKEATAPKPAKKKSKKKTAKTTSKDNTKTFQLDPKDPHAAETLRVFQAECLEHLQEFEKRLKPQAANSNAIDYAGLFRAIHGINACASRIELKPLEKLSSAVENLIAALRDEEITNNATIAETLNASVTSLKTSIDNLGNLPDEAEKNHAKLIERLNLLSLGENAVPEPPAPEKSSTPQESKNDAGNTTAATIDSKPGTSTPPVEYIRVDVNLLDNLVNLVGELVLARNQITQYTKNFQDRMLLGACQNLNLITSELQQACMKTRMQPISTVWNKIPRVVRDLAKSAKKQVTIDMSGKDTELDKSLLEAIKDPLTHMVRNSVDHGIETPEKRTAAGKNPEGTLSLRAYHEGGQVFIVISDDGAGIDSNKILNKALEKKLITEDQAKAMNDNEIAQLIFMAGLSTAEKVTNISGRGVGMDVVKTNIEKIGGYVNIINKPGQGSTFIIQLPLTLAIIPTLMVRSGEQNFAIPQVNAHKLIRMKGDQGKNCIEMVHGAPVYRLHGNLLPLVLLNEQLDLEKIASEKSVQIVVVQANHNRYGLVVDEILDNQEIVVKPLSEYLKPLSMYAGATILGDGSVALILDIAGLAQHAGVLSESLQHAVDKDGNELEIHNNENERTMLIVKSEFGGRVAILLDDVIHLKKFHVNEIEFAGHQRLVQYRNGIMPLISISATLEERRKTPREELDTSKHKDKQLFPVLIYKVNGHYVGLEVGEIIDIVNADATITGVTSRKGAIGTIVTQGQVTELFDINAFFELAESIVNSQEPNRTAAPGESLPL